MEVRWTRKAFDQMSQIIQLHPARKDELAAALQEVTARLRAHGMTAGESRGGNLRVYVAEPLTVFYATDEDANVAEVIRVRARFRA
jgi:hypothetical protein